MVGDPGKAICRGNVEELYCALREPDGEGEAQSRQMQRVPRGTRLGKLNKINNLSGPVPQRLSTLSIL